MPKVPTTVDASVKLGAASRSIVRVGGGRGFIVEKNGERFVITASHCLTVPVSFRGDEPSDGATLPLALGKMISSEERTYASLIGPLDAEPSVWVECMYVDPVADLAVLGRPAVLYGVKAGAYDELVDPLDPLPLASLAFTYRRHEPRPVPPLPPGLRSSAAASGPMAALSKAYYDPVPTAEAEAWMLALDGRWFGCRVISHGRYLSFIDAQAAITGGMSGSPVMLASGHAIGLVSVSSGPADDHFEGACPLLAADLPGWLVGGLLDIPPRPDNEDDSTGARAS